MKRDEFLKRVAKMCGPAEVNAVHQLAKLPPNQRHRAAQKMGQSAADYGLMEFLTSLLDDDLVDELASILPAPDSRDEAEELLQRLWARLLLIIGPQARDVLYAHNQLRQTLDSKARPVSTSRAGNVDKAYRSALRNARAVLAATDGVEDETTATT